MRAKTSLTFLALSISLGVGLAGCADTHQLSHLTSPDGQFVVTVDYIGKAFGAHDAVVSLQEKQGLAQTVATFRNVQSINVGWLGPSDLSVCEKGEVLGYKRAVTINAHDGDHVFHVMYGC